MNIQKFAPRQTARGAYMAEGSTAATLLAFVQNSGTKSPRLRGRARATWIFLAGAAVGITSTLAVRTTEPRAPRSAEVLPVRGVDLLAQPAAASMAPATLDASSTSAPAVTPGSARHVARAALAASAWIRGDGVYGAGVVIAQRRVLTCLHVVEKMKQIEVSLAEGPTSRAAIVDRDAKLDLAVLQLESDVGTPARIASALDLEMGDSVYAMGTPKKMQFSLTSGIVSYVGRHYSDVYYLQTDIATNGGNSGGPVLDAAGRVVGISSFILRDSQGLAFALPIDYAQRRFPTHFADSLDTTRFDSWLDARPAPVRSPGPKLRLPATH